CKERARVRGEKGSRWGGRPLAHASGRAASPTEASTLPVANLRRAEKPHPGVSRGQEWSRRHPRLDKETR
ncbi:hypothetical protein AB4Z54_44525, partial [Streptomyces sp. MCAF7]